MSGIAATQAHGALLRTSLHDLNLGLGAKMVPFAGYEMPVQFPAGILKEHLHTRAEASLFDVSHMGQALMTGRDAVSTLENLVPGDIAALAPSRMRYTMLTNDTGGIIDDLMVTATDQGLHLVLNAACKETDMAHIEAHLSGDAKITLDGNRALLALQGPKAVAVLSALAPAAADMKFMSARALEIGGVECFVSRSGYTGEDGFEISIPGDGAVRVAKSLLETPGVAPAGLGARDSLRLEAGLCLYGHDIDTDTTPVEAGLVWTISKRRRAEGGFPGDRRILSEIKDGPARKRVGIRPKTRAPAREGTEILDTDGKAAGMVTSGGFGPSVDAPVAMGYVRAELAAPGTPLLLRVRGRDLEAEVSPLPFVEHRYFKG